MKSKPYLFIFLTGILAITVSFSAIATKLIVTQGQLECEFDLASGSTVAIDPSTGDISASVSNLEDCMGTPDPPVITTFTATSEVDAGGTIQLSWNTQDADSCQAVTSGVSNPLPGWSGSKSVPSGNQSITAPLPNGTTVYRARLSCSNSAGTVQQTRNITVNVETNGPVGCDLRPPPNGLSRATHALWGDSQANGRFWNGVFSGDFPGTPASRRYYQQSGHYHAIRFNTGNIPSNMEGRITAGEPDGGAYTTNVALGRRFVSFSECPGDFHQSQLPQGCYRVLGGVDNIEWRGMDFEGHPFFCALKPNTTYYLNIVYTNSPEGDPNPTWHCTGGKPNCGALLSPLHNSNPNWP